VPYSLSLAVPPRSVSLPGVPLIVAAPTVPAAIRTTEQASKPIWSRRLVTIRTNCIPTNAGSQPAAFARCRLRSIHASRHDADSPVVEPVPHRDQRQPGACRLLLELRHKPRYDASAMGPNHVPAGAEGLVSELSSPRARGARSTRAGRQVAPRRGVSLWRARARGPPHPRCACPVRKRRETLLGPTCRVRNRGIRAEPRPRTH
jgi:hypothetical protein